MNISDTLIVKLLLAVAIGGVIGAERELRTKSAGFRTIILICLGATLFTMLSQMIGTTSPDRIASNVVVGIGFIGGGVIFKSGNGVTGITTAASMWVTAALGVCIGCGYYAVALIGCVLVLATLFLFSFFDTAIDKMSQVRAYKIAYPYAEDRQHKYENQMKKYGLKIRSRSQTKEGNIITGEWIVTGSEKKHHEFIENVLNDSAVTLFSF